MRYAAYLSPSRHGIFYSRLPIPPHLHPERTRTDMKLSLGTRCPKIAVQLSQVLIVAGQSCFAHPTVQVMKYTDIRQHVQNHFHEKLDIFKAQISEGGPLADDRVRHLRDAVSATEGDLGLAQFRFWALRSSSI